MGIIVKYTNHLLLVLPIIFVLLFIWNEILFKRAKIKDLNLPTKATVRIINFVAITFAMAAMVITYLELQGTAQQWQLIPGKTAWVFTLICLDISQAVEFVTRTITNWKPKKKFLYQSIGEHNNRTT